jgi:hypothetical protein
MLAPIGGTLLYSISPSTLWITCLVLSLAAAGLMAGAWLGERGTSRRFAEVGGVAFSDDTPAGTD